MIIEEMLKGNEEILWSGTKDEKSSIWEFIFSPLLPIALLWFLFDFFFITSIGIVNALISGQFLFFLVHLLPVWIYIIGILTAKKSARNTRYAVTTKGIYIQYTSKIAGHDVKFYSFDNIRNADTKQGIFDRKFHVGDIVCNFVTPIVTRTSKGNIHRPSFTINNITNYQQIAMLINRQVLQYTQASESLPHAAAAERNVLTERNIPASYGQIQNNPPEIPKPKRTADAQTVVDPQAAFFGQPADPLYPSAAPGEFLNTMSEEQEAFLEALPDESVSDLQTELFGADAKLSDAFPDPTVNPLPAFQEDAAPVFPQKTAPLFPDYQNGASPYALPQDQPAPWSQPRKPEMESLFPDEQKDENTDNFFFRSSL